MFYHRSGIRNIIRALIPRILVLPVISGTFIQEAGPGWRGLKRFATESTGSQGKKLRLPLLKIVFSGLHIIKSK
jgi:hypothetical protein